VTTTPDIGKINIPTQEAMVYVQATQKILDDAAVNMESWLAEKTADKLARLEATAFVTGDGVATPRGITTYASGTTLSSGQIQQVNMGSTSAFVYDGLVDVQNALKEVYQGNASWLMKRGTFGTLMKLKTGIASDNTPVFNMNYGQNNGLPTFTLLGRPVYFADDLAAIGSASLSVVYGDIKAAYTVVDRIGLRTLRDPFSTAGYVKFYTTKRVGGGVVNFEAVKISKFS
jgi:HK97 family phage major capsid protein